MQRPDTRVRLTPEYDLDVLDVVVALVALVGLSACTWGLASIAWLVIA